MAFSNRKTSHNDLRDKPFGEEIVETRVVLYDETETSSVNNHCAIPNMAFGTIDIVTFNGVEYAQGVTHSVDTVVGADVYTVNGADGFYFHRTFAESSPAVFHPDIIKDVPFTLKCEKLEQKKQVKTIDPMYLPDVTVTWDIDNMDSTGMPAASCSVSYDEFVSAVQSGMRVRGVAIMGGQIAMSGYAVAINGALAEGEEGWLIEFKHSSLMLAAHYKPDGTILHYS